MGSLQWNNINYDVIRNQKEPLFKDALNNRDYKAVLKVFNEKGIAAAVGDKLGIDKREYQGKVIDLIRGTSHEEIVNALVGHLP